jgi:phosphate acetyltransferase
MSGEERKAPRLDDIIARARQQRPVRVAIVNATDPMDIMAVQQAAELVHAVLLGPKTSIEEIARGAGISLGNCMLVDAEDAGAAARAAVEMVRRGEVDVLMKGSLHTDDFMRAVLAEPSLHTRVRMSQVVVIETPALPRLIFISDGAINIAPSLEEKRDITQNAIDVARVCGVEVPKVAILAAVETVSSRLPATIEAAAIAKMADRKQIVGGVVDGPLALDDAISPKAARLKGIASLVAGYADILIAPDLEAANLLFKEVEYLAQGRCAAVVAGARVPLILTSRADDASTRVASIALAILVKNAGRTS